MVITQKTASMLNRVKTQLENDLKLLDTNSVGIANVYDNIVNNFTSDTGLASKLKGNGGINNAGNKTDLLGMMFGHIFSYNQIVLLAGKDGVQYVKSIFTALLGLPEITSGSSAVIDSYDFKTRMTSYNKVSGDQVQSMILGLDSSDVVGRVKGRAVMFELFRMFGYTPEGQHAKKAFESWLNVSKSNGVISVMQDEADVNLANMKNLANAIANPNGKRTVAISTEVSDGMFTSVGKPVTGIAQKDMYLLNIHDIISTMNKVDMSMKIGTVLNARVNEKITDQQAGRDSVINKTSSMIEKIKATILTCIGDNRCNNDYVHFSKLQEIVNHVDEGARQLTLEYGEGLMVKIYTEIPRKLDNDPYRGLLFRENASLVTHPQNDGRLPASDTNAQIRSMLVNKWKEFGKNDYQTANYFCQQYGKEVFRSAIQSFLAGAGHQSQIVMTNIMNQINNIHMTTAPQNTSPVAPPRKNNNPNYPSHQTHPASNPDKYVFNSEGGIVL